MVRGREATAVPEEFLAELAEVAAEADLATDHDQALAAALSQHELSIYRAIETATGRRVHKGHALHNLGAAIMADDAEEARAFFHAAFVEDVRTDPAEPVALTASPARQTLAEMYGETARLLNRLEAQARDTTGDPVDLARAFEASEAPLPPYRGFRRGWRKLTELDGVPASELVFVAGAHALPDRMLALRQAVTEAGLRPVVVIEFDDFDSNPYVKSETLIRRCGAVVFDVSFSSAGYVYEMTMARSLGLPRWAGYVGWSAGDSPHSWEMTQGLEAVMTLNPVGTIDNDQLRLEATAWLREQSTLTPECRVLPAGPVAAAISSDRFEPPLPAAGTACSVPFANGSNPDYRRSYPEEPQATVSGWSLPPDASLALAVGVAHYALVDGKLVREDDRADQGIASVHLLEAKEEDGEPDVP